jgi:hypothetical protein
MHGMNDGNRASDARTADTASDIPAQSSTASDEGADGGALPETETTAGFDESIVHEVSTLIDDGRTYAEAEIAFQKIRAKLAGKSIGIALACVIVGLILLNIAFLALAVGLVIALAPLVTIWGAIGIVVGVLLLLVGWLGYKAMKHGGVLSSLFSSNDGKAGS